MHTLGIMSSGYPNTIAYIAGAIRDGSLLDARIGAIVCDTPDPRIPKVADDFNIRYTIINRSTLLDFDAAALEIFREAKVELILLTGYKKKVGHILLDAFPEHILNIHPGPIPRFGGKGMGGIRVQEAVLAAGVKYTGPVVHIVDEEYDTGPILGYWPVRVRPHDTALSLHERCAKVGAPLYVQVVKDFLFRMDHSADF